MSDFYRNNSGKEPNYTNQPDAPGTEHAKAGTVGQATEGVDKTVTGTKDSVVTAKNTITNFVKGDANVVDAAFAVNDAINSVQGFTAGISQAVMMPVLAKLAAFKGQAILPAGKQLDPVLGVDVHMVTIPPSPAPVPLPHPFVAIIINPKDWVSCLVSTYKKAALDLLPEPEKPAEGTAPKKSIANSLAEHKGQIASIAMGLAGLSASVKFGGFIPRAITGTKTKNFPHIPFGAGWHPAFAAGVKKNHGKVFLGSLFVTADGDPMAGSFHLNYDCWDVGVIDLFKSRRKSGQKSPEPGGPQAELFVPSGTVLPIPMGRPVLVNSIPTPINPLSIADRLFKAGLGKLKKLGEKAINKAKNTKLGSKLGCGAWSKVSKLVGTGQSHPVDVAEGHFYTDNEDFTLPGPIPLEWERTWYSYSDYKGPLGYGWHHSYDMALSIDEEAQLIGVRMSDGRPTPFEIPVVGKPSYNRKEKLELHLHEDGYYYVSDTKGLLYNFTSKRYKNPYNKTEVHLLQSIANRNGFAIRFFYDENGLLIRIIDSSGRTLKVDNDKMGRIIAIHAPHPEHEDKTFIIATYEYNDAGDMLAHGDALKQFMHFEYRNHLMIKEIWRNGLTWQFFYNGTDSKAKCIEVTGDDDLLHYKFDYSDPECTLVINSLGHLKKFFHKGGLVTKYIDPNNAEWIYRYNKNDELEWEIDPLGNQTGYTHDEYGNIVNIIQADGAFTQTEYFHPKFKFLPTEKIDERGGKWQWSYDDAGNVIKVKNPLGAITHYTYLDGLPISIMDALKNTTTLEFDARSNLSKVTAPNNSTTKYRYNLLGQIISVINPNGLSQTRELDLLGRITGIKEFDKNNVILEYDALDNITYYRDKKKEVQYVYNAGGKRIRRIQGGSAIHYNYDTEEQLVKIINEHGLSYSFELDSCENLIKETGFDGLVTNYQLNEAGWVTKTECGKNVISYNHDPCGRIIQAKYLDGSLETFQYEKGDLKKASNIHAQVDFVHDIMGNVVKEICNGNEVISKYDLLERRTHIKSSLGADIVHDFNEFDDITKMNANGWITNIKYDLLGLEVSREMNGGVKSEWQRDEIGRGYSHRVSGSKGYKSVPVLNRKYVWDVNDQLKQLTDNRTGTAKFEYDQWDNLSRTLFDNNKIQLRNPDAVGNLFETTERKDRKYTPGGKLIESKTAFYLYDEQGFLIEKKERNGNVWKYEWNVAGFLQRAILPDKSEVNFKYDPLGRRIEKIYKKTTTKYVWDDDKLLHEWKELDAKDATPEEIITWVFNEEDFTPVAKLKGEKKYSIISDHIGTPIQGYNEGGELIWDRELDSYGKVRMLVGDEGFCNYLYKGQIFDPETGLVYNRFRYYSPEEGLYISQDPIGLAGGMALYNYVHDPNVWVDIFGLAGNRNANNAEGEYELYGVYESDAPGAKLLKVGKAKSEDVMADGTTNRRAHTSARLAKKRGYPNAVQKPLGKLGKTTTGKAKRVERKLIVNLRKRGHELPLNREKGKRYQCRKKK